MNRQFRDQQIDDDVMRIAEKIQKESRQRDTFGLYRPRMLKVICIDLVDNY